jgi:hypothetical protein
MQLSEFLSSEGQESNRVVWVDHRAMEEEIVDDCSAQMIEGDRLKVRTEVNAATDLGANAVTNTANGSLADSKTVSSSRSSSADQEQFELWVQFISKDATIEKRIPLTETRHDRYVLLSSLAVMLKGVYSIYVSTEHLQSDTHGIALVKNTVFTEATAQEQKEFLEQFEALELGKDYFHGQLVPYLGAPNHNPNWELESEAQSKTFESVMENFFKSPEMQGMAKDLPKKIFKVVLLALLANLFLMFWRSRFLKIVVVGILVAVYFIFAQK